MRVRMHLLLDVKVSPTLRRWREKEKNKLFLLGRSSSTSSLLSSSYSPPFLFKEFRSFSLHHRLLKNSERVDGRDAQSISCHLHVFHFYLHGLRLFCHSMQTVLITCSSPLMKYGPWGMSDCIEITFQTIFRYGYHVFFYSKYMQQVSRLFQLTISRRYHAQKGERKKLIWKRVYELCVQSRPEIRYAWKWPPTPKRRIYESKKPIFYQKDTWGKLVCNRRRERAISDRHLCFRWWKKEGIHRKAKLFENNRLGNHAALLLSFPSGTCCCSSIAIRSDFLLVQIVEPTVDTTHEDFHYVLQ